jgi:hypothetical protein
VSSITCVPGEHLGVAHAAEFFVQVHARELAVELVRGRLRGAALDNLHASDALVPKILVLAFPPDGRARDVDREGHRAAHGRIGADALTHGGDGSGGNRGIEAARVGTGRGGKAEGGGLRVPSEG